jgi:hypothetical protein
MKYSEITKEIRDLHNKNIKLNWKKLEKTQMNRNTLQGHRLYRPESV